MTVERKILVGVNSDKNWSDLSCLLCDLTR
jgi:hypothetical protein